MQGKPRTDDDDQTPPDLDDILSQLDELGISDTADEGQNGNTEFPDTDEGKQQAAAFAKQRRLLKQARNVIRMSKEKPQEQVQQVQNPPQGNGNANAQMNALMYQLQIEAIQNTGVADLQHPVVIMEINRLYSEKVSQIRNRASAGAMAPKVFETVSALPQFKRLDNADIAEIRKRVGGLNPEGQADEGTVKAVFSLYVGENIDKFSTLPSGKRLEDQDDGTGAAASSGVRSRGSGIPTNGGRRSEGVTFKTPNEVEAREMRAIGLDPLLPDDVGRYRMAAKRRGSWSGA